jgi:hypothetical protein
MAGIPGIIFLNVHYAHILTGMPPGSVKADARWDFSFENKNSGSRFAP